MEEEGGEGTRDRNGERFKWNSVFRFTSMLDLAGGSMVESPNRVEKDATCEGMHSFCTGHKTFLRC